MVLGARATMLSSRITNKRCLMVYAFGVIFLGIGILGQYFVGYSFLEEFDAPLLYAVQGMLFLSVFQLFGICVLDYEISKAINRFKAKKYGKKIKLHILAFADNWSHIVNGVPELYLIVRESRDVSNSSKVWKLATGKFSTADYCTGGTVEVYKYQDEYYLE